MKDSSEHAASLKRLCNKLKRAGTKVAESGPYDITTEIVLACLSAHTTESKARTALNRLRSGFVDFNEMRVCRTGELVEILGKNFNQGKEVSEQIIKILGAIFEKRDSLDIEDLKEMGKRDAKSFLESLTGANPYVVSRIMLRSLGAHAFPVHDQMLAMLRAEEVIEESVDAAAVQGFLERQISVSQVHKLYGLLRSNADSYKGGAGRAKKAAAKTKKVDKTALSSTEKKKTVKKTAAKRVTKKTTKKKKSSPAG